MIRSITLALGIALVAGLPFIAGNLYYLHIATMIGVYWVLIATLNLLVGFTGTLSVGHVGLLAVGAYAFCILAGTFGWNPYLALLAGGVICALLGLLLGLPSLRLPGFYFAMLTLAFGLIVSELALAEQWLTNGSVGLQAPEFPAPFNTPHGLYWLVVGIGGFITWMTWNLARFMWGRAMVALRDSTVAAQSVAVPIYRTKLIVFVFSGFSAGLAGGLYATSQSYITPDAFVVNVGIYFFVAIIIGGRGLILGPFVGAAVLAALPALVGPLAKYGTFFYGLVLLVVVLVIPGGFGELIGGLAARLRQAPHKHTSVVPDLEKLRHAITHAHDYGNARAGVALEAEKVTRRFGGLVAVDAVSLELRPGEVHGLIGPNGSGKTTLLNLISGYYSVDGGAIRLGTRELTGTGVQPRARLGIARTFQTPKLVRALSVLDNAMLGGWPDVRSGFMETAFAGPRPRREEREIRARARAMLEGIGLGDVLGRRAEVLEHTAQRFLEIARALTMRPDFILLDEPAGGLTTAEIATLGDIIGVIRDAGIGVLLVEHHTDFVFRTCDRVTTLNLGRIIAHGLPKDVSRDPEVVRVYLGA